MILNQEDRNKLIINHDPSKNFNKNEFLINDDDIFEESNSNQAKNKKKRSKSDVSNYIGYYSNQGQEDMTDMDIEQENDDEFGTL